MPQSTSSEAPTTRQAGPSHLKRWFRRTAYALVACTLLGATIAVAVSYHLRGPTVYGPGSGTLFAAEPTPTVATPSEPVELTVMTLNVAHGRAEDGHQVLLGKEGIVENLDEIASTLSEVSPEIVALQEADGPSIWSGRFDHVAHLSEGGGFEHDYRGEHVRGLKLSYGTALLSRHPLENCASITFLPSPPTFPKGFVVGEVRLPGVGPVTVASAHLDFARESVRKKQVERIVEELSDHTGPLIVMGDFNCDWGDEATLPALADQLGLRVFEPETTTITFPKLGKRLDWILVSDEIEFVDYQVNEDSLSDHRAVIAKLRIRGA